MTMRYFAFLRAINVGGHTVKMADLVQYFQEIGFSDVHTFIASGNVIFSTSAEDVSRLERDIEDMLVLNLGYEVKVFIRSTEEFSGILRYQPFHAEEIANAGAINVGFLTLPLSFAEQEKLQALTTEADYFHCTEREFYWLCKTGQSQSEFSLKLFEKKVGVSATLRGMKTIKRLGEKYAII